MNIRLLKIQSGFALLIFLVILMGVGGLALTGFSQQALKGVEAKRFAHNKRVLQEAKQALLMYAYNYPEIALGFSPPTIRGPGRLPCPDTDNSGTPNPPCTSGEVGRLPVNAEGIQFYDARDSSGESLWYAVSSAFYNQVGVVNSDTQGTITIFDQTGNLLYDGATNGVAAVIIAPGYPLAGQDRNADPLDPANYLDTFGAFNNSLFVNGDNDPDDGFRLGPVNNNNTLVINDQIIIVTAAEVVEMAEKAVLEAYRDSVNQYLADTGDVYPWLYNYQGVPDVPGLSSFFPADATFANELSNNLDNFGRIPSIFANYFADNDSEPIESLMAGTIVFSYPATPAPITHNGSGGDFEFAAGATHTLDFQTANILTDVRFVDLAGDDGRLRATTPGEPTFSQTVYFWENQSSPNGFWTICAPPADDLQDCNRDSAGNLTAGSNDFDSEILKITINLDFSPGPIFFDVDYNPDPIIAGPVYTAATGAGHAQISVTYDGAAIDSTALTLLSATFEIDDNYDAGESSFSVTDFGSLDDISQLNFDSLELAIRYYPELPVWAFDNDWHNAIMMAYANPYRPDLATVCVAGTDCIQINNLGGNIDNKISMLTLAGQHNWDDDLDSDFVNDLPTIFEGENADIIDSDGTEYIFDRRAGNDVIMIIDEL